MIEKMNKYLFLVHHLDYEQFLITLRELGVVHIKETKDRKQFKHLEENLAKRKEIELLQRKLGGRRSKDAPAVVESIPASVEQGAEWKNGIDKLLNWEQHLENQVAAQRREIEYWAIWGDYSVQRLDELARAGYPLHFFSVPMNAYNPEWEKQYGAVLINTFRAHHFFVTVGKLGHDKPEAEEIKAPKYDPNELAFQLETLEKELADTKTAIIDFADNQLGKLKGYITLLEREYAFSNALVQAQSEADNRLMVLEGWVPTKQADRLESELETAPCYFEQLEISETDRVPIKLKNNRYAKLFEPITAMYSLPNYRELDITMLFAPFFMLFFALCLGDGGYGFIVFIGATLFKLKAQKGSAGRSVCSMLQWLGGTATIVGAVMGSVLGMTMPWASKGNGLLGGVSQEYFLNSDNMMYLSVIIGLIQIIFGKVIAGVKIARQRGVKYALSTFAWALLIPSVLIALAIPALVKDASLANAISMGLYGLAGLSLLIALFYNTPGKNPLINLGAGLWNTYNTASGLLGDSLSYIRLFAIGLTGGILGGVFNTLAVQVGGGLPIGLNYIVMGLILLFGHGLNIGLCMISSFVHPLRLTFVEFYKNAEFEGGGRAYEPLH